MNAANKSHAFWQRDSLAIELNSPKVASQKPDYIHLNPTAKRWNLVFDPTKNHYSSALFYDRGDSVFIFETYRRGVLI
jgi:putative transposase